MNDSTQMIAARSIEFFQDKETVRAMQLNQIREVEEKQKQTHGKEKCGEEKSL